LKSRRQRQSRSEGSQVETPVAGVQEVAKTEQAPTSSFFKLQLPPAKCQTTIPRKFALPNSVTQSVHKANSRKYNRNAEGYFSTGVFAVQPKASRSRVTDRGLAAGAVAQIDTVRTFPKPLSTRMDHASGSRQAPRRNFSRRETLRITKFRC